MISVDKVKGNGNDLGNEARSSGSKPSSQSSCRVGMLEVGDAYILP